MRPSPPRVLGAVGLVLTALSVGIELADSQPRAELWVGAAAGVAFLLAVPLVRGGEVQVLIGRARLLVGAGAAAVLAVIGLWKGTARDESRVLLLLVPALLLFITAWIAVREATRTGEALRAAQLRARLDGQEAERLRWAQELHDQTLQDLAAIEVRLGTAALDHDPAAVDAGLREARRMVREQIHSLRHLITQLRPLALDTLGLAAALQDLAQRAEDAGGLLVRCDVSGLPEGISGAAQVSVYRIVQEAVTNSLRHAAGHEIDVSARVHEGQMVVTVTDDGIGLPPPSSSSFSASSASSAEVGSTDPLAPGGFGRLGMVERADAIHGHLTWSTPAGGGTRVTLTVPLRFALQA